MMCHCPYCEKNQAHPATPDHGTYESHSCEDHLHCTTCGHMIPAEEVTPA